MIFSTSNKINRNYLYLALFFIILVFLVFQYYYGIFHFDYPAPPGDDPVRHMTEANAIVQTGFTDTYHGFDPPFFHTFLASIKLLINENIALRLVKRRI